MAQYGSLDGVYPRHQMLRGCAMDIPDDLTKLLAQLKQVTRDTSRMSASRSSSGCRPTAAEIDLFLSRYSFEPDAVIEQIEISNSGDFECYMFSVCSRDSDGLSLIAMTPE
jgi:hypothetical protein